MDSDKVQAKEKTSDPFIFTCLSAAIFDADTNTKLYFKFEMNKQEINCFDTVLFFQKDNNQLSVGRIMKIYQKEDVDTLFISLICFERMSDDCDRNLIFNAYHEDDIAINNIKSKVIVFDSAQLMDEYHGTLLSYYCEEYYELAANNNKGHRTLFKVSDDKYNTIYWDQQKQSESQKFDRNVYERRDSLNTIPTSSTSSTSSASILNQQKHPQLITITSPHLTDTDSSDSNYNKNSNAFVRNSNAIFNKKLNPKKRLRSQLQIDALGAGSPAKRRRISLSPSASLSSLSLSSSASSAYIRLLKTEIKLLNKSLNDKQSVIHQTNNLFGHFDKLIQQKDSVIDQKDEIIQQKNELLDACKFINE